MCAGIARNTARLNAIIEFRDGITASEQLAAVSRIEEAIRKRHPAVKRIFIEAHRPHEARHEARDALNSRLEEKRSAR